MPSDKKKVRAKYPDAHVCSYGRLTGLVHIITNDIGRERYKSLPMKTKKAAWANAAAQLESPEVTP